MTRAPRMRLSVLACAVALFCGALFAGQVRAAEADARVTRPIPGVYIWGGLLGEPSPANVHRSVALMLDQGFRAVRLAVAPNSISQYGLPVCAPDVQMRCAFQSMFGSPVYDDPRLELIVITLHDFSGGESRALDPEQQRRELPAIEAEYRGGLAELARRFRGRGVRVLISNWEGDNMVYCGSAYRFATEAQFATNCSGQSADGVLRRAEGFVNWLNIRARLINEFRTADPDFNVQHAPEINNVLLFETQCRERCVRLPTGPALLERVTTHEICLYSSYDSLQLARLAEAVRRLQRVCPTIALGEVGTPVRDDTDARSIRRLESVISQVRALSRQDIDSYFVWNAFDRRDNPTGFGLFSADGQPRLMRQWRAILTR